MVQFPRGFKVVSIRSDNGTKFVNIILDEFFKQKGIEHQRTVAHNGFQNGAVEHARRSLEDKAHALLIGGNVPKFFWSEGLSPVLPI